MSYIGTSKVGGMYLGDTKIDKAYLGDDLVYSAGPPQPKIKTTTFTRTVNANPSGAVLPSQYWYNFIIGAEYEISFSYDVNPYAANTRLSINNDYMHNFWRAASGSFTVVYNTQVANERINVYIDNPQNSAVITVTIKETIYPS